jgi:hypothetical protein
MLRSAGLAAIMLLLHLAVIEAQGTTSLTGVVRDSTGRPLAGAAVVIDPETSPYTTRTDNDGRFRFDRLARGRYRLRVTWIGYAPEERDLELTESSVSIEVVLVRLPYQLDTLSVVARRGGIIGRAVISPTLDPLANVSVEVLGARWRMRTSTNGVFEFSDVPEGGYTLQVRRDGYRTKTIPVMVPPDGAVEVVAAMDSLRGDRDKRFENRLRDMEGRLRRASRNDGVLVPNQELAIRPGIKLDEAIRYAPSAWGRGMILLTGFICTIHIDGIRDPVIRLRDIRASDVLTMEVYRSNGCAEPVPGRSGLTVIRPDGRPGYNVWIWLKRP